MSDRQERWDQHRRRHDHRLGEGQLVSDKASNLTRVDVDTNNGTVYLNGTVESPEQKSRAEQLAWQASGVKTVVNNLQVQKR